MGQIKNEQYNVLLHPQNYLPNIYCITRGIIWFFPRHENGRLITIFGELIPPRVYCIWCRHRKQINCIGLFCDNWRWGIRPDFQGDRFQFGPKWNSTENLCDINWRKILQYSAWYYPYSMEQILSNQRLVTNQTMVEVYQF